MLITLTGRVPSKKNSKQIVCRGSRPMVLPSKQYREWHTEALWQLKAQRVPQKKLSHFDVHVWFYAPDRRKADASNKFESIMDLLVDYGAIEDDSWWHTEEIVLHKAELDTKNPRVEIEITPVS